MVRSTLTFDDHMKAGCYTARRRISREGPCERLRRKFICNGSAMRGKNCRLIVRSFKECGLSNALDDFEGNLLHYFKPDGSIPTGQELFARWGYEYKISQFWDETELFVTAEDEENDMVPLTSTLMVFICLSQSTACRLHVLAQHSINTWMQKVWTDRKIEEPPLTDGSPQ